MSQKNPYYLNEQNEMSMYNRHVQVNYNNMNEMNEMKYMNNNNMSYPQIQYIPPQQIPNQQQQYNNANNWSYQHQYSQPYYQYPPPNSNDQPNYNPHNLPLYGNSNNKTKLNRCPICNQENTLVVQQKFSWLAYVICLFLLFTTVFLFWVPFCCKCLKYKRYRCVRCYCKQNYNMF